ncbi:MAG: hypothetical protein JWO13_2829 [Acidobacteriales bacterium]|nr:hypothetical protein [Terriglobales bacterium]
MVSSLSPDRTIIHEPVSENSTGSALQNYSFRKKLWFWGPAFGWLIAIAIFSTEEASAANTGSILLHILRFLHLKLSFHTFTLLHGLIRKSAHFCVYALLSGLFFRAWRGPFRFGWRWTWMLLALAVCLVTSSSDEIHQLFTPGRTGAATDVLLDMSGAFFMQLMIIAAVFGKQRTPMQKLRN